ncbi:MAG: hypothetical protein A2521_10870 [Deltaproteobacteria bacterium RIFOXYD12_FULL_57_12]|nr:MAG: hypothetical protein A2521_10870 [Deltaproteobacteria bacterium RIFOXYD12_FULL_57_12]
MKISRFLPVAAITFLLVVSPNIGQVNAEDKPLKIATVSIQEVLSQTAAAQEAKKVLEAEVAKIRGRLQTDQDAIEGLRSEIEKKNSVWSEAVRLEKDRELQKKMRELQVKTEDAQFELQQMEKKVMSPILKELQEAFAEVGKQNGYSLILEKSKAGLESRSGLLYADDSIDISDKIKKALEARLAKGSKTK